MKNYADKTRVEPEIEQGRPFRSSLPDAAVFILVAMSVILFGLIVLYSTSYSVQGTSFFYKQLMWVGIGTVGFASVILFGYRAISNASPLLLPICAGMLIAALRFKAINGAHRWLILGPVSLQPSEFFKVVLVLFMAWFLSKRTRDIENAPFKKVLLPCVILVCPVIALVMAGKDLGTTVLLTALFFAVLYVAGIRLRYILPVVLLGPLILFELIRRFSPERLSRITSFMNPELYQKTDGYQLWNSLLALGSGGWFGVGFTESRLKLKYLPEAHTDFILAIVGEELGLVTILTVLFAYLVLIYTGSRIACKSNSRQGMLVAFGMIAFIGMQAVINVGVICGAFPTKGMPAPMISYGGSSLVACMLAVACVFSVALDNSYQGYAENLRAGLRSMLFPFLRKKEAEKRKKGR